MAAAVGFEPTDIRVKAVRLNHLTMPLYQDAINKPYRNIFTIQYFNKLYRNIFAIIYTIFINPIKIYLQ